MSADNPMRTEAVPAGPMTGNNPFAMVAPPWTLNTASRIDATGGSATPLALFMFIPKTWVTRRMNKELPLSVRRRLAALAAVQQSKCVSFELLRSKARKYRYGILTFGVQSASASAGRTASI
jgi:hypothetical protein